MISLWLKGSLYTLLTTLSRIKVFVIYLDGYRLSVDDKVAFSWLLSEYSCYIVTNDAERFSDMGASAIIPWKFHIPDPLFQRAIMREESAAIGEIAYISDDPRFIRNALSSLNLTIMLRGGMNIKPDDTGFLPDHSCVSLHSFVKQFRSGLWSYFGENAIADIGKDVRPTGRLIISSLPDPFSDIRLIAAGRYYGSSHYLSAIDRYSYALRANKSEGKLSGRFDGIFAQIFSRMIGSFQAYYDKPFDGICNVPVRPGQSDRFRCILEGVSHDLDLDDYGMMFKCIRDYGQNKTLSHEDRMSNVRGAFVYEGSLSGKRIALIDDIKTTGATLSECVASLFRAGAFEVVCFVLGVNQFACDYWVHGTYDDFRTSHTIRYNSSKMKPFFSGLHGAFHEALDSLISDLDSELMSLQADDDSLIPFE